VVGGLVGDSAAVTSHWVYDQAVLKKEVDAVGGEANAPFMDPVNPYYHVKPGSQSCYGDQTYALLKSLAAAGPGASDLPAFMKELDVLTGEDSAYGPLARVVTKEDYPIKGAWRHGSLKEYMKNVSEGKNSPSTSGSDDKQIDGACKAAPIVASYAPLGLGAVLTAVETAVRVTQDTDESVSMALAYSRILYAVGMGEGETSPSAAVADCIAELRKPTRLQPNAMDSALADRLNETLKMKSMGLSQAAVTLGLS
jgi:hypothetical protein